MSQHHGWSGRSGLSTLALGLGLTLVACSSEQGVEGGAEAATGEGSASFEGTRRDVRVDDIMVAIASMMVDCMGTIGPESFELDADGFLRLPEGFRCTRGDAAERRVDGDIRSFLSLQRRTESGAPGHLTIPNAKEQMAGRWAAWKEEVARTGLAQAHCPVWTETRTSIPTAGNERITLEPAGRVQSDELGELKLGAARGLLELDETRILQDFRVAFAGAIPEHACAKQGPGACAALCAGAFPGFVNQTGAVHVLSSTKTWLDNRVFPNPGQNPYLSYGFYHMTWQYGEYVGNRNRANNCAATGQLFQACNKTVMAGPGVNQTRSCSNDESATQPDNCASEICSVYTGGVNHQNVRLRLDCYDPMDQQEPNTQEWLDTWDTCVAVCFLPP